MDYAKIRDVEGPRRAGSKEAGIDFFAPNDMEPITIVIGDSVMIPLGVHVRVPDGHALIFFNKSGVAVKRGLKVGACVIDETYQGELILNLFKDSDAGGKIDTINPGDKIIQGLIVPVNYCETYERVLENLYAEKSQRGSKGFGSDYEEKL